MESTLAQLSSDTVRETGFFSETRLLRRTGIYAGLAGAILLYWAASFYWIDLNTVQIGRDAGGHLVRTLEYSRLGLFSGTEFSPQAIFRALTVYNAETLAPAHDNFGREQVMLATIEVGAPESKGGFGLKDQGTAFAPIP